MTVLIQKYESLKQATALALQETQGFESLVQSVLTSVVIDAIRKYQQKINVGIQDSVSDLLETFKRKVTQAILDAAGTWKVANREPVLFPRGCRFCYARGESTIFVIEEDPKVRSLLMSEGILDDRLFFRPNNERIALSLPYAVFVVHFRNNVLSGLYCGWRTLPLNNLNNLLSRPILPNIHDTLAVCMGRDAPSLPNASPCEQTISAINYFWNSQFNNDISEVWWNKSLIDHRLQSARMWAQHSESDPNFILTVDLPEHRSLQYMIDLLVMHEQEPDENAFRHRLTDDIDKCVEGLFAGVMRYFKKTKFQRQEPTDIKESLREVITQATSDLTDIVFVLDQEIKKMALDLKEEKPKVQGQGPFWLDYITD